MHFLIIFSPQGKCARPGKGSPLSDLLPSGTLRTLRRRGKFLPGETSCFEKNQEQQGGGQSVPDPYFSSMSSTDRTGFCFPGDRVPALFLCEGLSSAALPTHTNHPDPDTKIPNVPEIKSDLNLDTFPDYELKPSKTLQYRTLQNNKQASSLLARRLPEIRAPHKFIASLI